MGIVFTAAVVVSPRSRPMNARAAFSIVLRASAGRLQLSRLQATALLGFTVYVAWSYLSISWAQSPGDALTGSNRGLLYLLVFTLLLLLPWTPSAALAALLTFAGAVGVIAIVLLFRLCSIALSI